MEPDLSEFTALARPKRPKCPIALAMPDLSDDDLEKLAAALVADPGVISANAIAKWFGIRGHRITHQQAVSHRDGRCSCGEA